MKGTVLGFDGSSGAITGEDGKRYSFASAEWKSETPAKAGDEVDFVAEGGAATEIYALKRNFAASLPKMPSSTGLGAGAGAGAQAVGAGALFSRPQVIFYALPILAFFFLNFLTFNDEGVTALDLSGALDDVANMLGQSSTFRRNGAVTGFEVSSTLAVLLWAIPLSCGFGIFKEYSGEGTPKMMVIAALACFYSFIMFGLVITAYGRIARSTQFSSPVDLGAGGYVMLACGIGLMVMANKSKQSASAVQQNA